MGSPAIYWCMTWRFSVFFFKQKTAYEMRISDWSSDVCSSDLAVTLEQHRQVEAVARREREVAAKHRDVDRRGHGSIVALHRVDGAALQRAEQLGGRHQMVGVVELDLHLAVRRLVEGLDLRLRSEEHTSELQSLMRISYAV